MFRGNRSDGAPYNFPPGPPAGPPVIGHLVKYLRDPTGFMLGLATRHGDYVRFAERPRNFILAAHPDAVREVLAGPGSVLVQGSPSVWLRLVIGQGLLTSDGELHRRQRRLMQPAFHRQRIAGYAEIMSDIAARTSDSWQPGSVLDVHREMMNSTLQVVTKALFGSDVSHDSEVLIRAGTYALSYISERSNKPFTRTLHRLPLPGVLRFHLAMRRLDAAIDRILQARRLSGRNSGDLLSMLLEARDEEHGTLDDRQLRDEVMTVFLAGYETTAAAMTWTLYLIAQHPEAANRLETEIDEVLSGRLPEFDDVPRLTYTGQVLSESMRLYPPVWAFSRQLISDFTLGPYRLPARSEIILSPWVTHHDARWYPDPFTFDPERWTPERQAGRPKFSFFPFGGGGRQCIGEGFAWLETTILLATLVQRWRFLPVPGQRMVLNPLITLRPKHVLRLALERRS